MRRALAGSTLLAVLVLAHGGAATADAGLDGTSLPPVLQRFLDSHSHGPTAYRALRHIVVRSGHLSQPAWMDVWTEADPEKFSYEVIGSGGSEYVRDRVFLPVLEAEQELWGAGDRSAFTLDNYAFDDRGAGPSGLAMIGLTPRRKDVLLIKGALFLSPDDGDLLRVEGTLSKTPSFWTRRVEVTRRYQRIAGARVPVSLESVASIFIAGKATFTMTYDYESVNGHKVGSPAADTQP